jgi:hypothetical protein
MNPGLADMWEYEPLHMPGVDKQQDARRKAYDEKLAKMSPEKRAAYDERIRLMAEDSMVLLHATPEEAGARIEARRQRRMIKQKKAAELARMVPDPELPPWQ